MDLAMLLDGVDCKIYPHPSPVTDEDTSVVPAMNHRQSPENGVFKDSSHRLVFRLPELHRTSFRDTTSTIGFVSSSPSFLNQSRPIIYHCDKNGIRAEVSEPQASDPSGILPKTESSKILATTRFFTRRSSVRPHFMTPSALLYSSHRRRHFSTVSAVNPPSGRSFYAEKKNRSAINNQNQGLSWVLFRSLFDSSGKKVLL
ncbi:hypothetical protein TorRG33x02_303950 [Trema orientale]|uniref:Uncharacterized protein n=1 Tax=Trema orientale TaxID=63057 RepID=A0A2P5BYT2_TREOI|nr:hypothetical protein TorRG33x02_303950 [Trema orientale]